MKWQEFEKTNPKAVYVTLREICEEVHTQGGFFCNYCYQREGWYCFPCDRVRKIHEKRTGASLDKLFTPANKEGRGIELQGGMRFWR